MIKISKEVLSEILEKSIKRFSVCDNYLYYTRDIEVQEDEDLIWVDCEFKINIYELIHKGKEWAFNKGYIIDERGYWLFILTSDGITDLYNDYGKPFAPVRVFEVCEWLYKEINK